VSEADVVPDPTRSRRWSGAWRVLVAGVLCGAAVWALSIPVTGMREPFDSPGVYYPIAMLAAGALAALPAPRFWWLAVIAIFLGERLYAFVMLPETRPWLLFSLIVNLVILTWIPAAIGAAGTFFVTRWLIR
jgi:hypothetical protein